MTDYIKRSDALNFDMSIECEPDELSAVMEGMARVMEYIKQIPAADVVEVVHGSPVKVFEDPWTGKMFTTCSRCDGKISPKDKWCKHCGAKIDGRSKP